MNFRKLTALILTAAMACSMLSGCKKEEEVTEPSLDPTVTETTTTETSETTTEATTRPTRALDEYKSAGVNELNSVPVLMYHRIYNMKNSETQYTGGNVDKDGYNRTSEAFEKDLRSFYEQGYRHRK